MSFGLLGADVAYKVCIGHFAARWDLGLGDEKNSPSATDLFCDGAVFTDTVRVETSPFVCEAALPDV